MITKQLGKWLWKTSQNPTEVLLIAGLLARPGYAGTPWPLVGRAFPKPLAERFSPRVKE